MLYHYLDMMRIEDKETSKDWEFLLDYLTESFKAEGRLLYVKITCSVWFQLKFVRFPYFNKIT